MPHVEIRLVATDALGQSGESTPAQMTLPERTFNHPIARAIIDQRKELAKDSRSADAVAEILGDLKKNVPTGTALTDNAPAIDYRVTTSTPDGHMSFFGTAKGFVAPSLDFSKIKSRLSGQSTAAARIYLGTLPIESAQVSQKPVSLPLMPILGSRIKIVYEVQTTKPPAVTPKA